MKRKSLKRLLIFFVTAVWLLSGWPQIWHNPPIPPEIKTARATDTGGKTAGTAETTDWTGWTTTNLATDDDNKAQYSSAGDPTGYLSGFVFSIPTSAQSIDGILVQIVAREDNPTVNGNLNTYLSWDDGTSYTAAKRSPDTDELPIIDTSYNEGGSTDTWGRTWTVDELNNHFKVKIVGHNEKAGKNVEIDQVVITIYYTPDTVSISINTDGSVAFETIALEATQDTTASGINDVETINVDSGPADLDVRSTNFTEGGNTWTLNTTNGANQVKWEFSKNGTDWSTFAVVDTLYVLDTNVAQSQTRDLYLRITMPTSTNSYNQYSSTVTIIASAP